LKNHTIKIAIAGIGNCASSLIQGLSYYAKKAAAGDFEPIGLLHPEIGGWRVEDIEVVAAFDIDSRKVGKPLEDAIFALPNNTKDIDRDLPRSGVTVQMGKLLDGCPSHMLDYPLSQRFDPTSLPPVDVAQVLRDSGAEMLVNYMPVGSQQATEFYAQACLDAGVAFVNCVPCFVVSDPVWAKKFTDAGLPCIGDDVKAQLGATITHRTLARLFHDRGVRIDATYQLNTGGNTDFLNMLNRDRLTSKKVSKTEAVQSQLDVPLDADKIHIGPSDFVPFQKDNKVCFLRIEGTEFGGIPMHVELRLSVEDSPNSAGVVVDAIRCCKIAKDAGVAGPLEPVCAWTMKHPPRQMRDSDAMKAMEDFISAPGRSALRGPVTQASCL
jgi:myo-inositol-1-phosphate synthase